MQILLKNQDENAGDNDNLQQEVLTRKQSFVRQNSIFSKRRKSENESIKGAYSDIKKS